ncbi:hypothetical protein GALMADRAFT_247363 [Galerina marginata CBS 339.88]|uniref:F-box domain-containing protein n=1 Tax=Galerina marginata (strain CBS 339.88) TaxID=685588 RepID=A0A067SYX5_GALM3|nr:hypothetical protein GALMADRAFT_247363 [Galerina marginata CBS 339.88]
MTHFTSLPTELILKIFHLASIGQPQSFRASLSLVCKDWLDIAREVLFENAEIRVRGTDSAVPPPDFAHRIKNLVFQVDDKYVEDRVTDEENPESDYGFQFPEIYTELARAATSISSLTFSTSSNSYVAFPDKLLEHVSPKNITHLSISGYNGIPVKTIFQVCYNLENLVLDGVFFLPLRNPKTLKLPPRRISHFHLNVWSFGQYIKPVFEAMKDSISSLSFGISQSGRLQVALQIVGQNLKSLTLLRPEAPPGTESPFPPSLLGALMTIKPECPNLEQLSLDAEFDWSTDPLALLLNLPPSLKSLSISKCHDISTHIVSALRQPDWLPQLTELRVGFASSAEGGGGPIGRDLAMELCSKRGIRIRGKSTFMRVKTPKATVEE